MYSESIRMHKRHPLSDRFHQLLKEIGDLHDKKRADYGSDEDPFANVNQSKDWGIEPWIAACLRIDDKIKRLQSLVKNGRLRNESAVDSMRDIAAYSLIAEILYEQKYGSVVATLGEYRDYFSWSDSAMTKVLKKFKAENKIKPYTNYMGLTEAVQKGRIKLPKEAEKCLKPRKSRKNRKA